MSKDLTPEERAQLKADAAKMVKLLGPAAAAAQRARDRAHLDEHLYRDAPKLGDDPAFDEDAA